MPALVPSFVSSASPFPSLASHGLARRIESALHKRLEWTETQTNSEELWFDIRAMVSDYLFTLFRQGALCGSSPEQAYYVRCDHSTNSTSDIAHNTVNIVIGYATIHPSDFAVLRIARPSAAPCPSAIFNHHLHPQSAS
jgi:phage tail sheath protein FI